jgi:hypothetical protein
MKSLADIADSLRAAFENLSPAQRDAALKTIFGNDAIRVGIALYEEGGASVRKWTTRSTTAGAASRVAGSD